MSKNRLKIGVLQEVGQYPPNFYVERDVPHQSFSNYRDANECVTTFSLTVFTGRNFVADFLQAKLRF